MSRMRGMFLDYERTQGVPTSSGTKAIPISIQKGMIDQLTSYSESNERTLNP
ncbi:hypothetical protein J1N35_029326 [Gossypium stocksii]|uniref:Uncharacterized protein n=1 Tax=Gossypium stocksii TaxID=47602 RepID=A0A9D3UZV4_9ROSI|nr:hypothetical protein J1N35_029326 [Gossypium stocksii]